jgi:ribosomal protein S18 acetylase RimI-like enzyme
MMKSGRFTRVPREGEIRFNCSAAIAVASSGAAGTGDTLIRRGPAPFAFNPDAPLTRTTMRVDLVCDTQHESLIDLLCELHAYYNEGALVPREVVREHLLKNLLSDKSPHRLVVASTDDGQVLGLAAITWVYSLVEPHPETRKHCQLKELYVRSTARSSGVGRALMSWVARHAFEHGCRRIDWPVNAANARGIAFYERLGAQRVVERLSYRLSEPGISQLALFEPERLMRSPGQPPASPR